MIAGPWTIAQYTMQQMHKIDKNKKIKKIKNTQNLIKTAYQYTQPQKILNF